MGERGDGKVGLKADQKYKMNKGTESVKKKVLKIYSVISFFCSAWAAAINHQGAPKPVRTLQKYCFRMFFCFFLGKKAN